MGALADMYLGSYSGTGRWCDETGKSQAYSVAMSLARSDDALILSFKHVFDEEPGTDDLNMSLTLKTWPKSPTLLTFDVGQIQGRGYVDNDLLHYDIPLPDTLATATYRFTTDGRCLVNGSSDRNADGNYIMWTERLKAD